jgi:thiamine kinase-like enzyme
MKKTNFVKNNYFRLILIEIFELFRDLLYPKKIVTKVQKVQNYVLVKRIDTHKKSRDFVIGKYKRNKRYFFIKSWQGKIKDFAYFNIINEYNVSQILNKYAVDKSITVLNPEDLVEEKNRLSLIYKFIDGKKLSTFDTKYQVYVLKKVIKFIHQLSGKISKSDKQFFPRRDRLFYLLTFPLIVLNMLFKRPSNLLSTIIFFRKHWSRNFFKDTNLYLNHGDLHPNNILISGRKIYLLDCEDMMFSLNNYDLCHLIIYNDTKYLLKELIKNSRLTDSFIMIYLGFKSLLNNSSNIMEVLIEYV